MVNKRVWNAVLGCNLKNDRMISVSLQSKPFNITVIQAYAPTSNDEEAEVEQLYEGLQDRLELTPNKDVLFIPQSKPTFACYSRYFLTSYFCIPVPYNEKDIFFGC